MPLPCEIPLSNSQSNPVSLPGAIAALSAQVTSTMLEVRQEIGELKCEIAGVRDLCLQLSTSLINEQLQRVEVEFQIEEAQKDWELKLTNSNIQYQEVLCGLAVGIIKGQSDLILLSFRS